VERGYWIGCQTPEAYQKARLSRRVQPAASQIPLFAIGYEGWSNSKTAREKLAAANKDGETISGHLQIDPCFFVGAGEGASRVDK
jgi:hypothetical protein